MDISEIAQNIFSQPPKEPNSIQLDFSETDENLTTKDIFEMLLIIFQQGMIIHHGDANKRVDLSKITHEDFLKINRYFNSFNFKVNYNIKPLDHVEPADFSEKKNLKDHYLRLRTGSLLYYISFDYYLENTDCKDI